MELADWHNTIPDASSQLYRFDDSRKPWFRWVEISQVRHHQLRNQIHIEQTGSEKSINHQGLTNEPTMQILGNINRGYERPSIHISLSFGKGS